MSDPVALLEQCAKAAYERDRHPDSNWSWDTLTDDDKAPFLFDMQAAFDVLVAAFDTMAEKTVNDHEAGGIYACVQKLKGG